MTITELQEGAMDLLPAPAVQAAEIDPGDVGAEGAGPIGVTCIRSSCALIMAQ